MPIQLIYINYFLTTIAVGAGLGTLIYHIVVAIRSWVVKNKVATEILTNRLERNRITLTRNTLDLVHSTVAVLAVVKFKKLYDGGQFDKTNMSKFKALIADIASTAHSVISDDIKNATDLCVDRTYILTYITDSSEMMVKDLIDKAIDNNI